MVYTRGGVWTNVEDEILRVAISKYGLNQWARVSSLLARKTAKQAKARWTEWLDPSIKKVEWSRDEDEKLLHLAKLMPTQWRSIAPIVGRTANQCIERYQQLLDDAENRESASGDLSLSGVTDGSAAPASGSSATRLQIGDIDHAPETKPAKPDAIDMDEDEKEMLAEARARLANTQGKKAKRKDRERLLEESKRLALLQKRRELKQAGINTKLHKKNKTGMDYNVDIPLEHRPAAGFYDTTVEHEANLKEKDKFERTVRKNQIKQGDSARQEEKANKRDREDRVHKSESAAAQAAAAQAQILSRIDTDEQISKRRKLELPAPQVQDDELDRIIKYTRQGDSMKERFGADEGVARDLAGSYEDPSTRTPLPASSRTSDQEFISRATNDLRNIINTQSALLGQESMPFHEPNLSARGISDPSKFGTPNAVLSTPRRDALGLFRSTGEDPKDLLRAKLKQLPKPRNEIEIILPDEPEILESSDLPVKVTEDRGERDARIAKEREADKQRELASRSTVLRDGLPRPQLNVSEIKLWAHKDDKDPAHALIRREAAKLMISDLVKYPILGLSSEGGSIISDLSLAEQKKVEDVISQEAGETPSFNQFGVTTGLDLTELSEESLYNALGKIAENCNKHEKKLSIVLGGYQKRQSVLTAKMTEAFDTLNRTKIQLGSFQQLRDMEDAAINTRIAALQDEVNFVSDEERKGQERYRELKLVFDNLQAE